MYSDKIAYNPQHRSFLEERNKHRTSHYLTSPKEKSTFIPMQAQNRKHLNEPIELQISIHHN